MKKYSDFPQEIQDKIAERQVEQGNPVNMDLYYYLGRINGGFDWWKTPELENFWGEIFNGNDYSEFYEKYPKVECTPISEIGQKFSQGKLPFHKVLFSQFPLAIEEVVRASNAGHLKYLNHGDEDWQNFSRVPNAKEQYLNAALRHLRDSETKVFNEDMAEYDPKVRHLAQFVWNGLAALEMEMREVKKSEETKQKCSDYDWNISDEPYPIGGWVSCTGSNPSPDLRGVYVNTTEEQKEKLSEVRKLAIDLNKSYCDLKEELDRVTTEINHKSPKEEFLEKEWEEIKNNPLFGLNVKFGEIKNKDEIDSWSYRIEKEYFDQMKKQNDEFPDKVIFYGNTDVQGNGLLDRYKPEEKIPNYYFSRPTLSVDQLIGKDDYPDFPVDGKID